MRVVLCNESQQRSSRVATRKKILRLSFNVFYELRIPRTIQSVHIRALRRTSFTLAGLYPTDSFTIIFDYVEKRMHKKGRCIRARNGWKIELDIKGREFSNGTHTPSKDSRTYTWMGLGEERTCVRGARRSEYETRKHASRARKAPILVAQLRRRGYGDG